MRHTVRAPAPSRAALLAAAALGACAPARHPVVTPAPAAAADSGVFRAVKRGVVGVFGPAAQRWPSWGEYANGRTAAVVVSITPRVEETLWSLILSMLVSVVSDDRLDASTTLAFAGDLGAVRVLRDGEEVVPLEKAYLPVVLDTAVVTEDMDAVGRDRALQAILVLPPEAFAPRADGTLPEIVVVLVGGREGRDRERLRLDDRTLRAVWRDFEPYRRARGAIDSAAADAAGPGRP